MENGEFYLGMLIGAGLLAGFYYLYREVKKKKTAVRGPSGPPRDDLQPK